MIINAAKAKQYLGIHIRTLQKWDKTDILKPTFRTSGGKRMYDTDVLDRYLNKPIVSISKRVLVYARVSGKHQINDLKNQVQSLCDFCTTTGVSNFEIVDEIGGGLNFDRPKFKQLIKDITSGKISKLIVAHKDRLCRFGFEMVDNIAKDNGCEIVILNNLKLSPQEEMVTDLMTIIHCFSSRLYGLRSYKNKIKADALA